MGGHPKDLFGMCEVGVVYQLAKGQVEQAVAYTGLNDRGAVRRFTYGAICARVVMRFRALTEGTQEVTIAGKKRVPTRRVESQKEGNGAASGAKENPGEHANAEARI